MLINYHLKNRDVSIFHIIFKSASAPYVDENDIPLLPKFIQELYYYVQGIICFYNKDCLNSFKNYELLLTVIDHRMKAKVYFNVALTLHRMHNYFEALTYVKKALDLHMNDNNFKEIPDCYTLIGILYWELDSLQEAEKHFHTALKLSLDLNLDDLKGRIYHNLGLVYKNQENYTKSLEFLYKWLELKGQKNSILIK